MLRLNLPVLSIIYPFNISPFFFKIFSVIFEKRDKHPFDHQTMQTENDLVAVELCVGENLQLLLQCSREKNRDKFHRHLIYYMERRLPELKQAFEYARIRNKEDINAPVDPKKLLRAKRIRETLSNIYDHFSGIMDTMNYARD
jgi:hypothetical protein